MAACCAASARRARPSARSWRSSRMAGVLVEHPHPHTTAGGLGRRGVVVDPADHERRDPVDSEHRGVDRGRGVLVGAERARRHRPWCRREPGSATPTSDAGGTGDVRTTTFPRGLPTGSQTVTQLQPGPRPGPMPRPSLGQVVDPGGVRPGRARRPPSGSWPRTSASPGADQGDQAGRLGLPRCGTGVRNGASVSTSSRSSGHSAGRGPHVVGRREGHDAAEGQVGAEVEAPARPRPRRP